MGGRIPREARRGLAGPLSRLGGVTFALSGRWRTSRLEMLAIVLLGLAAATQVPDGAWNGASHFALVQSLADGTPQIDAHLNQSGDIAYVDGHFYTAKAPGLALFSLPAYVVADTLGAPDGTPTSPPPGARYVAGRTMWNVNLVVIGAYVVLLLLVRLVVNRLVAGAGTAVALILGLGTLLLPMATSYFAHDLSAALGFAAFAAVLYERSRRSYATLAVPDSSLGLRSWWSFPRRSSAAQWRSTFSAMRRASRGSARSPAACSQGPSRFSCSTRGPSGLRSGRATRTR